MHVYSTIFDEFYSIDDLFGAEEAYKLSKRNVNLINLLWKNQHKTASYR